MKVAIEDILDEGLSLDFEEDVGLEDHALVSPVKAHLELEKTGPEIVIQGGLNVHIELTCSRCLKKFTKRFDLPVHVVYHPLEDMGSESHELKDDEMDMEFYTGSELDLHEVLKEQIVLSIQMKPLCDTNCKGICPQCGIDLNSGTCDCDTTRGDSRFEALRKLL